MQAGKMDRRVKIQRRVETQNAVGEAVISYTLLAEVWAEKKFVSGREIFTAAQFVPEGQVMYKIRYRPDVNEKCRIVDREDTYDIIYIAEVGRREALELTAKKPA
jgi:SPP1 family predicted phage head-tail adaptor